MKIVLIYPPDRDVIDLPEFPETLRHGIGVLPPMGLLYLAAGVLLDTDWEVEVIDATAERLTYGRIEERIRQSRPDAVGITVMTHFLITSLKIAGAVKRVDPAIKVIFGGLHAHLYPKETLAFDCVDYAVTGEGEHALAEMLKSWNDAERMRAIPGLCFKASGGAVTCNPPAEPVDDLDKLPHPPRGLLKQELYSSPLSRSSRLTTMITSRGCPFACVFCERPNLGRRFRSRSAADVADELEECAGLGIREILFYDDTFTAERKRVLDICDEIRRRRIEINWDIRSRVDTVDFEMLKALKSAGCRIVNYGVESGNDRMLKIMRKGITKKQVSEAFELTRKAGMQSAGYFMMGYAGETRAEVLETMDFAKQLDPDYCHFAILIPLPGTPLYQDGLEKGIFPSDYWREFARNPTGDFKPKLCIEGDALKDASEMLRRAYKEFYMRPSYIMKTISRLRSFSEFRRKCLVGLNILKA